MAKKNPYVTTIGFNREDPDHLYVAGLLNDMGRGKAQYIVKAIMAYQNPGRTAQGSAAISTDVDYEKIRNFVLQVLEERATGHIPASEAEQYVTKQSTKANVDYVEMNEDSAFDDNTVNDILASLRVFR